jgi:hypothetical protein
VKWLRCCHSWELGQPEQRRCRVRGSERDPRAKGATSESLRRAGAVRRRGWYRVLPSKAWGPPLEGLRTIARPAEDNGLDHSRQSLWGLRDACGHGGPLLQARDRKHGGLGEQQQRGGEGNGAAAAHDGYGCGRCRASVLYYWWARLYRHSDLCSSSSSTHARSEQTFMRNTPFLQLNRRPQREGKTTDHGLLTRP